MRTDLWYARRARPLTPADEDQLFRLIQEAAGLAPFDPEQMARLLRRYPRANGQFAKDEIVAAYRRFCDQGRLTFAEDDGPSSDDRQIGGGRGPLDEADHATSRSAS